MIKTELPRFTLKIKQFSLNKNKQQVANNVRKTVIYLQPDVKSIRVKIESQFSGSASLTLHPIDDNPQSFQKSDSLKRLNTGIKTNVIELMRKRFGQLLEEGDNQCNKELLKKRLPIIPGTQRSADMKARRKSMFFAYAERAEQVKTFQLNKRVKEKIKSEFLRDSYHIKRNILLLQDRIAMTQNSRSQFLRTWLTLLNFLNIFAKIKAASRQNKCKLRNASQHCIFINNLLKKVEITMLYKNKLIHSKTLPKLMASECVNVIARTSVGYARANARMIVKTALKKLAVKQVMNYRVCVAKLKSEIISFEIVYVYKEVCLALQII